MLYVCVFMQLRAKARFVPVLELPLGGLHGDARN